MKNKSVYKWVVLSLLWLAFFLNQADRQIFNSVLPLIKADLQLSDWHIGLIASSFNIVFAILVPLAGYIGDRYSKKWVVVLAVTFWSIATACTGFSTGIVSFILLRSLATGGGEAFFAPANYSLLAEYHKETRSFAMSVHQTAYYLGVVISGFLSAYIGERYGWRSAFFCFGSIGIIHGIVLAIWLKDANYQFKILPNIRVKEVLLILLKTPTALIVIVALTGQIFVLSGYLTWMPTYLYENFGLSLSQAGFHSVFYTHLFAFIGIIISGKLSDKLAKVKPTYRVLIQGIGLLFSVPFILLMANSMNLFLIYIGFAGFGFGRGLYDSNIYTVLYDVIPKQYHSSASGIMLMICFFFGSLCPLLLGWLKPMFGLSVGISLLSIVWVFSGLLLLFAYRYSFKKDYISN